MNPNDNVELESPEVISKKLLDAIIAHPDGHLKSASEAGSKMVRRRIRENGFTRLILPFKPVSNSELARLPGTELPVMIEEMEPDSPGAKSISFNDSADTAFYRAHISHVRNSARLRLRLWVSERLQFGMYALASFLYCNRSFSC